MNVGRTHQNLQVGQWLSLAGTIALCLLWTIPITFFASLSSVQALSDKVPFIAKLIDRLPFLAPVLEVIAPLLVKIVNALLPALVTVLTLCEGPVSSSVVEASNFSKLAAFMIIQTFFVSAVSGSLLQSTYYYCWSAASSQYYEALEYAQSHLPILSCFFLPSSPRH